MLKKFFYTTFGGIHKNVKFMYYLRACWTTFMPEWYCRCKYRSILRDYAKMSDAEKKYVDDRVNYYCDIPESSLLSSETPTIGQHSFFKKPRLTPHSIYFFDSYRFTRYFPKHLHWNIQDGDISSEIKIPTITKSRPIPAHGCFSNNVILKLNRIRHFIFINDPFEWEEKTGRVLFRGVIYNKVKRRHFVEMYGDNPLCDLKDTHKNSDLPERWKTTDMMSIYDHLSYRYIMALEGNDVASNLKWVMSSNSAAVMPRPTCETWFMEGRLIPGYHYIEIASDFSDLLEKITYYEAHPEEAKAIVAHAHEWVEQFKNKDREELIGVLTMQKYLKCTN